jgi:hypothetical protein
MFPVGSTVCECSQNQVLNQHERMAASRDREEGGWFVERGREVVLVAEAMSAGWNKVTFERLVDRCSVVCLSTVILAPTVV